MRALVTGGAGFVGSHLAARLIGDGWDVVGTVRPGTTPVRPLHRGVRLIPADLGEPVEVAAAARAADPDVAFLLGAARAAATSRDRAATVAVNASSVQWLVDALGERCRVVVRLGSSTEYGAADGPMDESSPVLPRGFFGATKAAGSLLVTAACETSGRRAAVLRAFQVFGPHDHPERLVPRALAAARTGRTLPITAPGRRRDWVYVDDVVEACVRSALADHLPSGQVLNIGTGRQFTNEELVAMVERVSGRPIDVAVGAHPGRHWDTGSWVCDPSLAQRLLGWEAKVDLEVGLRRCWEVHGGRT